MNILIVGGNGGIGFAMITECLTQYSDAQIHATYRRTKPQFQHKRVRWYQVNVSHDDEVKLFSELFDDINWVINCVGILHTRDKGPEKNLTALDSVFFQQVMTTNTLPTLLLAKYFTPKLKKTDTPKFAVISAKVGSISDNQLGGWYSYRASKAALNMFIKTMSIEWQRILKNGVVLALHPGTTDTPLSEPFQANVPQGKLFTPERVAYDLIGLIASSTPQQSGSFLAYSGEHLPW
ncbi:SDR family oxidoreductase [Aliivibrio sp. S4TY2]|uniref:SDR family oxidoreductase n=1 Tax=unclassified Aliivibrio TaxID=2645654 RepID=UPI002379EBD5|nr:MULTISPECIES: SDR family oxidoreductase [unclassified Aliivibrio]MDD9156654.1 SDR family oxidoreductase [Aliivibrio sp. S4TY2]MDD9159909.1 SDR family oxidoreductase [Aliivibrio sp. S4TY1]MDD9164131.1 SDR family oxidoreductase [Aliivibrio sp. S4MY2]MDD9168361.1 SDR family oxidoreductase [Aliivibrio sp. S4MY4]MDD9184697.1 SDR family oxidoreductase [Aliivibrio sp. S4MY3]